MKKIAEQFLSGERALFQGRELDISYTTFADGESPLKESKNIQLYESNFKWKYPLWYAENIQMKKCTLFEMARAGIWYTHHISLEDCMIEAPKEFRRATDIHLKNVVFSNAEETLWNCSNVQMEQVTAKGNYFAMNSTDMKIDGFQLVGNYCFDGAKNVEIRNAKMLSKDAFWNAENITVYDSYISGEYLGWNSKNVKLVNCTIESLQGMCYCENLILENCRLVNTTLAFEYSTVQAEVKGKIGSVMNPKSGFIHAEEIEELIMDESKVNPKLTDIVVDKGKADVI